MKRNNARQCLYDLSNAMFANFVFECNGIVEGVITFNFLSLLSVI